ncbi:MAG: hypothetical protein K2I79_04665, partial [Clostridia bacterium]|nr:hypothetical protein [Clostridia bacterium]
MSKSRRYTLITIAVAAVLIVATVCAVLLTDGIAPSNQGGVSVSPSATTTKTTAGTVDSQYLKTAVESIYNPAAAQERILANGSPAVYYISRHSNRNSSIYLINTTGTINSSNRPKLRDDQTEPTADTGYSWWWFEVGNTTYFVQIARTSTLQSFLSTYSYYSNSSVYALLTEDVTYNPSVVYNANSYNGVNTMPYNFNATLDGAGHKISASADFAPGDKADSPITSEYPNTSNVGASDGTQFNAHSMFIANLGSGTLKNFTFTDDSHTVAVRQKHGGSFAVTYGAMVGLAGVYNNYDSSNRSYINNVHVLLNGTHTLTDVPDNLKQRGTMVMGAAVGYNRNCNIEQLTVTLNNNMQSYAYRGTKGLFDASPGYTIHQSMGVVIGAQDVVNAVFKKVIAAGSGSVYANWNQNPSGAGNWTETAAYLGIIFGQVVKATTVDGVILDFTYGNIY